MKTALEAEIGEQKETFNSALKELKEAVYSEIDLKISTIKPQLPIESKADIDSLIVKDKSKLSFVFSLIKADKLKLLYRGSRDGWMDVDFHSRCDD